MTQRFRFLKEIKTITRSTENKYILKYSAEKNKEKNVSLKQPKGFILSLTLLL